MFTREQYESALRELGRGIREGQRRMLAAHANAPGGLLDVSELAATAGQSSDNFTYAQYGALGHMIAAAIDPTHDEDVWTRVIGDGSRDPDTGMVQWRIHPALASAVRNLEWVTDVTLLSGSADVTPEPSDLVSPTVREALVELRLTQGEFRTRLIRYCGRLCRYRLCRP